MPNPVRTARSLLAVLIVLSLAGSAHASSWTAHAPLPEPLANNAVTAHTLNDTLFVYSFMGIDTTKIYSGIRNSVYRLNTVTDTWQQLPDVPDSVGRIAALATSVNDKIYLFGGYSVKANNAEISWDVVNILDPVALTWSYGASIPIPVDDMVGGVWRDSLVYLVSGWSNSGNIKNVQVYDPTLDSWAQATEFPTEGTFGGAGGIVGDWIVYADGVRGNFLMRNRVHRGAINPLNPLDIAWDGSGRHPGPGLYRMGSGNIPGDSTAFLFSGGSDNPYNFDGDGYNGQPSEPVATTWLYFPSTESKLVIGDKQTATMDHRGMPEGDGRMFLVGGMVGGQQVTDLVESYLADDPTGVGDATPFADLSPPAIEVYPNPARTSMKLQQDSRGVMLRNAGIYDVRGRLVRRFQDEDLAKQAGFEWDLRDGRGRPVPAGIYFLQGQVFDRNVNRKITVLD